MKERIINEIIRVEGGYVNNPSDSGGGTNFGITVAVARQFGYSGAYAGYAARYCRKNIFCAVLG